MSPSISVVLPVYNGEKYIAEALDSILSQTFTDFELIVINDGSRDDSLKILQEYQQKDSRIFVLSRENKGAVTSQNEGIALARGTWIARMDHDDIALPHRFERQLQQLEQTGADICGSWVQFFGTADKRILKHPETDEAIKVALLFGSAFAHPTVMMRTAFAKQLLYNTCFEKCDDYDLWERAARAGWVMTNVPEVLLRYRLHESQISTKSAHEQQRLTQIVR
jgi:glycosyltransferase involved in cell wall biosynthesis